MNESELIKKRFAELANRAYLSGTFQFTDFLGLNEQSLFKEVQREFFHIPYTEFGGAVGSERIMVRFGDEESLGYSEPFPIVTIKVAPKAPKFAEKLTHRDFLGALLNLGIERATLGDIPIIDNTAYIFAQEGISSFIISELNRVKHTDVVATITDTLPDGELYRTERVKIQANGERLDAVIAKVFKISREESLGLFARKLVFVSGRCIENNSYVPKKNEKISVRGFGRMIYLGYESTSKKGKLNIEIDLYV